MESMHTPVWGWTEHFKKLLLIPSYFNPHPRMGDEQTIVVQVSVFVELQPASLHRDERNNLIKNQLYRIFNSHPVRDEPIGLQLALDMYYFNPHPLTGMNLPPCIFNLIRYVITTHTPAGDERWIPDSSKNHRELQSTFPHGGWTRNDKGSEWDDRISTHTPAWGMNRLHHRLDFYRFIFQSTPLYGDELMSLHSYTPKFITTHTPHGDERHTTNWKETIIYFNTHLPHGGWTDSWYLQTNHMITFQPAPLQGGLPFAVACVGNPKLQPTPPYGDEHIGSDLQTQCTQFQPTPPHWGWTKPKHAAESYAIFQPTPPHGDELWTVSDFAQEQLFQPTPPYGDEQQKESIVLTTSND